MKTIIVDDSPLNLKQLLVYCEKVGVIELINAFSTPSNALCFAKTTEIDLAILDIDMPEMNGLQLAKELRHIYPNLLIIYCTGYDTYALEAYKLHSIDYLLKPFNFAQFERAILTAKAINDSGIIKNENENESKNNIFIKTFGRFDIFVNNQLVLFKRAKAKELLALLVDMQGGLVTLEQAINVLWEDHSYNKNVKQMYRDAISQLRKTLIQYDCSCILKTVRGGCYLDLSQFECDYYQLLENCQDMISEFHGEYMFDYSWAEETLAKISRIVVSVKS